MRETKKVLKLNKFKVANLRTFVLQGGTNTNPCNATSPSEQVSVCCVRHTHTCENQCTNDTTRTNALTTPQNPCDPDGDGSGGPGLQTGPGCP